VAYDARRIVRRGGPQLLAILEPELARQLALRLEQAGLHALLVPESEARGEPLRVLHGERAPGGLALRTQAEALMLAAPDLLLVVSGPIARERGTGVRHRKVATGRPEEGWCVHLHRRNDARPLELDPARIELGFSVTGSARLEIATWVADLAHGVPHVPHDETFSRETPALARAETQDEALQAALVGSPARAGAGGAEEADARALYDNLAQFRFYSGWRGAVERRRQDSRAPRPGC
jgi:hypothetical protein